MRAMETEAAPVEGVALPTRAGAPAKRISGRRGVRRLGNVLVLVGCVVVAYALAVVFWHDPVTDLYTRQAQHRLASEFDEHMAAFDRASLPFGREGSNARSGAPDLHVDDRIARVAAEYRRSLHEGDAVGRIVVPRLGLDMIFVNGTEMATLRQGPGRSLQTWLPGERKLVYIAGHRTTYLAPFRHIERLSPGDRVVLEVPYGTFEYRVTKHVIVPSDDVARLEDRGRDEVALQACHPRFFATHRNIAYARLVRAGPPARSSKPART
jgi:sortase A